jgi:hypothetical protein
VLKSFAPTIQELNQVTSELRTNMSKEMGLNELQQDFRELQQTTRSNLSWDPPPPLAPLPSTSTPSKPAAENTSKGPKEKGLDNARDKVAGPSTASFDAEEQRALSDISKGLAAMDDRQAATSVSTRAGTMAMTPEQTLEEDPDIEQKRRDSATLAWGGNVPPVLSASISNGAEMGGVREKGELKRLEDMTLAELEAELAKRRDLIDMIRANEPKSAQKQA